MNRRTFTKLIPALPTGAVATVQQASRLDPCYVWEKVRVIGKPDTIEYVPVAIKSTFTWGKSVAVKPSAMSTVS